MVVSFNVLICVVFHLVFGPVFGRDMSLTLHSRLALRFF